MSKHFEDARYYLGRAADHAKEGVKEELEPVEDRVREIVGREKEPEPSRLDRLEADLTELSKKAEGEAKAAVQQARERLDEYRSERNAE
ncbi:DUF7553 family protein [Halobaculum gomorrense]|uniref:Uncharacterized protein n=1 Tax=Halobaculum gomorrense TaxID=43928 RepID=A0A1M5K5W4_9EURY|nr:hypothetical protein [Halobaculum gomorrense]SHG48176.1 hypothetical protein SAMN05443636_0386 [Halobaculum gomorrense]